ncbi:MAG: response regulator, partial [Syntrophothermus sp.]
MKVNEILVVEDNNTMRLGITESLKREGYIVYDFSSGPDAVKSFMRNRVPFAVIDLKMEPIDGLEVLRLLKEAEPQLEVLMISAFGTVDDAVKAIRMGASDFLTKPFSPDELRIRVNNIFEKINARKNLEILKEENRILKEELYTGYDEIIGTSGPIKKVFSVIEQVAGRDST